MHGPMNVKLQVGIGVPALLVLLFSVL